MALNKMDIVDVNLNTGNIHRSFLSHTIGLSDNNADSFGVRVFRDGNPVDLSGGWVQGFFRNPMGENIALTSHGTISGNTAYVTLPQACYNYDGQFTLAIKIVSPGSTNTVTMRIVDGTVDNTNTGGAVAPTSAVPTYQEILAVYNQLLADVEDYESVVATQNGQISDLKSANKLNDEHGKQTFRLYGNFQHYGLDTDGTFLTWQTYRVSNNDPMTFDRSITVDVQQGFRWGYIPYINGAIGSWSGWFTNPVTIKEGTSFIIQIARVTEDSSEVADVTEFTDALTFNTILGDYIGKAENESLVLSGVKAITPAIQSMFEKVAFNGDVGHAPQGLAINGNTAYVSNGATVPLNVINEINLIDGTFVTHTIAELVHGVNSLALDAVNGILYASEHYDGGKVFIIDISTWICTGYKTLPSVISSISNNGWNIVYDPIEQCFYNYSDKTGIIYKLNSDFEIIKAINIVIDDKYPLAKPGVTQGFGYDGTYFYIPRSEVYDVYGNSFIFVVDKTGHITKYIRGCHDEIEEVAYDFYTGKTYACYALAASGYITEFVSDSGWIAINDYLSDNYQSKTTPTKVDLTNTDAKFRVKDGSVFFNGKINAINNDGNLCYLDGRIAPMIDTYTIIPVTSGSSYTSQHDTVKVNLSAVTYWSPDFQYKYVPILNTPSLNGYWWMDGVSAPLGRD